MSFLDINPGLYAAAMLGQSAYEEGLPNDPYQDEGLLELLAYAAFNYPEGCADIVDTWQANWEKIQKELIRH